MLPMREQRQTAVVPQTHVLRPRNMRIQTSGMFKFPLELFLEVFSYLADHRRFIRENYNGRDPPVCIGRAEAERSVIIRRLTMTCWPLRDLLLPLLWIDAEGCIPHSRYDYNAKKGGLASNPYAQCIYLAATPEIAAYVQAFSVQLCFDWAPGDLMTKFVDCLVRLPNLKTLEILSVSSRAPVSKALKRKYARFPSIRELRITHACHHFIRNCPNLENLTLTNGFDMHSPASIRSHGGGLKRIAGVDIYSVRGVYAIAWGCPNLREIGIFGRTETDSAPIKELRRLEHLAVVNVELEERKAREPADAADRVKARMIWKRELVGLLKDSPSTERKILRWKIAQSSLRTRTYEVVEDEELEVSPETSP